MIPVAILKEDKNISLYSLVLLVPGAILASYHTLLYHGVIEKAIIPCNEQVSCTSKELELFGFMGIPLMSLLTFVFMIVLMGRLYWKEKRI